MTVAFGLGAAVAWAVVNLWLVTLSRRIDIAVTTLAVLASSTVVTLPLALAFEGAPGGDAWSHAPAAAAAGLLELAGFGCYIVAIRRGTLAVVAPLVGLEGGIAALVAIAGGEAVGTTVVVGIVLAVVGTSLSCAEPGERRASGAGWAILAGGVFGLMFVMYGQTDPLVVTARAENHLHGVTDLDDTIARLVAYRSVGADCLYAPGLTDTEQIAAVVAAVEAPVNVLALPGAPPVPELERLGVRRVSTGSLLARTAYGAMLAGARELLGPGTSQYAQVGVTPEERAAAFTR